LFSFFVYHRGAARDDIPVNNFFSTSPLQSLLSDKIDVTDFVVKTIEKAALQSGIYFI